MKKTCKNCVHKGRDIIFDKPCKYCNIHSEWESDGTEETKYYIRFGDLPKEGKSAVHQGDGIIKQEAGISVWNAAIANDVYYPVLPKEINESALQDYIGHLWGNQPVYLVTGVELDVKGTDNEPLLENVKIVKPLKDTYNYFKRLFGGM